MSEYNLIEEKYESEALVPGNMLPTVEVIKDYRIDITKTWTAVTDKSRYEWPSASITLINDGYPCLNTAGMSTPILSDLSTERIIEIVFSISPEISSLTGLEKENYTNKLTLLLKTFRNEL